MQSLKKPLLTFLGILSIVLFTLLVCVTVWQVFTRQVLDNSSTWSEELSKILFVWLSFVGSAFLFGERGHIAVDYVARRFGPRARRVLAIIVQLIIIAFALGAMIWGGYLASSIAWHQNLTALPFTIGWVYVVIPAAGVFIALFALMDLIALWRGEEEPYPEIEDPDEPLRPEDAAEVSTVAAESTTAPATGRSAGPAAGSTPAGSAPKTAPEGGRK